MTWSERDHPRHPRGSDRGGEFRGRAGGGWVQGVLLGLGFDLTPEQEILQILAEGTEIDRTNLAGGNSAETSIATFRMPDGSTHKLVTKSSDPTEARLEILASAIGGAIGAPVPTVVQDPHGMRSRIWMPLLDGDSPMASMLADYRSILFDSGELDDDEDFDWESFHEWRSDQEWELEHDPDYIDSNEGRLLGLLDLLLKNRDRHTGNWLILRDGGIAGIDHTHIDVQNIIDDEFQLAGSHGPFTEPYVEANGNGLVNNDWHPADIAEIEKHLHALFRRPSIVALMDQMGTEPEVFLSRLALIGARAKGTERRFE